MALKHESWDAPDWDKPKPPKRNDVGGLTIFLIGVAIVLAAIFVPALSRPLFKMLQPPARPRLDADATVWIQRDAGNYYCADSKLYGQGNGTYMKQGEALTAGYQPALGNYCNQQVKGASSQGGSFAPEVSNSQADPAPTPRSSPTSAAPRP